MNVVHFSCVAPPETGGIGQSAYEMVKRLNERGVNSSLVAPALKGARGKGLGSGEGSSNVARRSSGTSSSDDERRTTNDERFITRLPALIRYGNAAALGGPINDIMKHADVVHLHYPFFGTAEKVAQYCQWRGKPLVMTFHMDATGGFFLQTLFDMYRLLAQPAVLLASRTIFVSSLDYAQQSSIAGFLKTHPGRVVENPFGVDTVRFYPRTDAHGTHTFRSTHGIPEHARVVGFVGGMDMAHAFKGVPVLLDAMKALPQDVHALLVGDGNQRVIFEAKAKELGVAARCHFIGRLPSEELGEAYRSMDVLAFPSTSGAEAFGLVAAEAQACGIPVVASDLPGVRTVVLDGRTGTLVPPRNAAALSGALNTLLDDHQLNGEYGMHAVEHARASFNWDRHVDTLTAVYRDLCASPS